MAAPSALGNPCPIAPPVTVSQSWRGAFAVAAANPAPEVGASSMTTAPSGSVAPMAAASLRRCEPHVRGARFSTSAIGGWCARRKSLTMRAERSQNVPGDILDPVTHERDLLRAM